MAAAASFLKLLPALLSLLLIITPSPSTLALSSCNGPCSDLSDCDGELICTGGRCSDDPDAGTRSCTGAGSPPKDDGCNPIGPMVCEETSYPTYACSASVSSSTNATLTLNNFSRGGEKAGPSECDESFHDNSDQLVAQLSGWFVEQARSGLIQMLERWAFLEP
ncbi:kiwellin-like [Nymphaea colorata]|uniref:kiwellin-like n=1 Tax=Nymphaea colorata TaxID=210225 RepID=UPI00214E67A7|nr:kiwellin-like [Nymphaea colorata]